MSSITAQPMRTSPWPCAYRKHSNDRPSYAWSFAIRQALTAHREALKEYARKRVPLQWAMTQNNLGNALRSLGERENDCRTCLVDTTGCGLDSLNCATAKARRRLFAGARQPR